MYKYTEKFVMDLLFNENKIRIGTLQGFRDMEAKHGISDPKEGSYNDIVHIDKLTGQEYYDHPKRRENFGNGFLGPGCEGLTITNSNFIFERSSPNFLIFCCAHTKSADLFSEFDGADVCYEIRKPQTFFELITWALEKKFNCEVIFRGIFKVDYDEYDRERPNLDTDFLHPALVKTKTFSPQCELRAIWQVPEGLITEPYYDLQVVGIRKSCRVVEF